jgi:hypothetical protein
MQNSMGEAIPFLPLKDLKNRILLSKSNDQKYLEKVSARILTRSS